VQIIKYFSFIPYIEKFASRILPPLLAQGVAGTKSGSGTFRYQRNCFLVVLAGVVAGYGAEMLMLYVIPSIIGIGLLVTWFQWLPHQPNTSTDRYLNTRVYTWLFSTFTLIEQDHHLIHHMFPRIPFYRYRTVYRRIRPSLVEHGAHLDGRAAFQ
jgi:fatty acid desaturase